MSQNQGLGTHPMLSLPLSSLLTPLLHEGIENGVVSRFFFYDKQLGHCHIKPSKRNTPISPFGEESEKQREKMAVGIKGNTGGGGSGRGRSYGLMLILAFGAAVLGVMVIHKLRDRRIFNLLVKEKDRQLISLQLLLQVSPPLSSLHAPTHTTI